MNRASICVLKSMNLRRLEISSVKNVRCSYSKKSKPPLAGDKSKPPNDAGDKRKWTWKEIKEIQRYRKETQLLFGDESSKETEYSVGNEVFAAVGDTEVLSRLSDKKMKALIQEDSQLQFPNSSSAISSTEGISGNDHIVDEPSSERNKDDISQALSSKVMKSENKLISDIATMDKNSQSDDEEEEEFVDYYDDPSEIPLKQKPSKVQSRKKMTFPSVVKESSLPLKFFPRDFPAPKSPMDKILVFPLLPSDKRTPDLSDIQFNPLPNGRLPSVTRILGKTMSAESRAALDMWEKKKIEELGLEGFQNLKLETFKRGHQLHACIEQCLHGAEESELDITHLIEGHWKSMSRVFTHIGDVHFTEARVQHPILKYTGIFDCVAYYKNSLCLIDWKTSKKQKSRLQHTYDNPVQLAAYIGALNHDPNFEFKDPVHRAVLVIAYEDGSPAHVYQLSPHQLSAYWRKWTKRLHQYYTQNLELTS